MHNPIKQLWGQNQPALGAWLMIPSVMTAEEIGQVGYDFVCLDMQHGMIGYEAAVDMLRAINLGSSVPLVRVPWNDHAHISKILDAGAMGVIIPMVNTAEEAAYAVASCRFPPQGERSHAVTRAFRQPGQQPAGGTATGAAASPVPTPAEMNDAVLCIPMVETTQAVENLAAMAEVPGIDAFYVGPGDLSISLGLPPGNHDGTPEFDRAVTKILDLCAAKNIVAGIQANPALAAKRVEQGFKLVTVAVDNTQLRHAMAEPLAQLRG